MKYLTIPPPESLKPFVRCFWVLEHDFGEGESSYVYRSIADSCVEMVFHYRARFNELGYAGQPRNWLSGIYFQTDRYTRFEANESFGIFGVYIYPLLYHGFLMFLQKRPVTNSSTWIRFLDLPAGNWKSG